MKRKDYYAILGVGRDADDKAIKRAYRRLAMKYHPDRNPGKEQEANDKFKEINEAYAVLGDPEKRSQYDRFGTVGDAGDIFSSPYTRTTIEDLIKDMRRAHLGFDVFDDVFSDSLKGKSFSFTIFSSPQGARFGGRRGINLEEIFAQAQRSQHRDVSFEDLMRDFSGANLGSDFLDKVFTQAQPPQRQDVRYEITITREQAARGLEKDLVRRNKKLRVKIPAGIKSGAKVRLRNARQITDGQPGDIMILVKVK